MAAAPRHQRQAAVRRLGRRRRAAGGTRHRVQARVPAVTRNGQGALRSGIVLVLAFDTATAAVTVALSEWSPGRSPRMRAESKVVDRRRHAEVLAPAIDTVLGEAQVDRSELSAIAVGVGPGPYTGLRVGLVTARSLGAVLKIPVHGVCTLDALAWESRRTEPFVVATDARRKEVYWARYDSATVRVDGPSVGPPGDAA